MRRIEIVIDVQNANQIICEKKGFWGALATLFLPGDHLKYEVEKAVLDELRKKLPDAINGELSKAGVIASVAVGLL